MLEPKKLYTVTANCWLVYPTKELVQPDGIITTPAWAGYDAHAWSKKLDCLVTYIKPGSNFMVVEVDGTCIKILGEKLGWVDVSGWGQSCFEEITHV